MRLECSSNDPTRMPECILNASRMPPESISIFSVLKESNWNAVGMQFECPECGSNAARMQFECPECGSNAALRIQLECTSNAVGILDCRSNAARMQLECPDHDARMHFECPDQDAIFNLDCSWSLFRYFQYFKNQTEMHFNCRQNL